MSSLIRPAWLFLQPKSLLLRIIPWLILVVGAALSAGIAYWWQGETQRDAQNDFQRNTERLAQEIQLRFQSPIYGLYGMRAAYVATHTFNHQEFSTYLMTRNLVKEFLGVRGFGFVKHLTQKQLPEFIAENRTDNASFALHQFDKTSHDDVYIVQFIEPAEKNQGAVGLDLGSEPVRRAAIEQAISSGQATFSQVVHLVQDKQKNPAMLLFVPVYNSKTALKTDAERIAAINGVLYAPIVVSELLQGSSGVVDGKVDFTLFDSPLPDIKDKLLFDSSGNHSSDTSADSSSYSTVLRLPVAGRIMTLNSYSTPKFDDSINRLSPWLIFFVGSFVSLLLMLLLRQQAQARQRAENIALSMNEELERLALVVRRTSNLVVITDSRRRITWVNNAFERVTGYTLQEVLGQSPGKLLQYERTNRETINHLSQALDRGIPFSCELQNRSKEGREYWIDVEIQPRYDSHQNLMGFMAIESEITERKIAQAHLEQQQQRLEAARSQLVRAADVAELGIWSWDLAEDRLSFDERMCQIYQINAETRESLSFQHWQDLLHPDDAEETIRQLRLALKGEGHFRQTFRIILPDGSVRVIQAAGTVERNAQGRATQVTGINREITAQQALEETLRKARTAADEANQAKSDFLANMSHELRTPMNAILGMLTILRKTQLDAKQADYAAKSEAATRTLLRLLNDILDFSKIEAGKMMLDPQPFNIHDMLRDLGVILSGNMQNKQVELLFDVDPALPQELLGDGMRLQQVLINLGGNAIKFTERGEVMLFIQMLSQNEHEVCLQFGVKDSGIGIAPEHQERIFSGFTQAEASISRRFGGTGLGVAISQRLVNLMGGKLELESSVGQGSLFYFTLTLPRVENSASSYKRNPALLSEQPWRVLVVDDNPLACDILQRQAEGMGWQVDVARSGEEALEKLTQQKNTGIHYQTLLVDWQMPGLDGWQTCHRIRSLFLDHTPVIVMVTAYDREILAQRTEDEQKLIDGYLVKPITASMLLDAVMDAQATQQGAPRIVVETAIRLSGMRLLVVEDNLNNQQIAKELLEQEGASVVVANHGQEAIEILQNTTQPFHAVLMDLQMPVMDGLTTTRYIRQNMGLTELPIIAMTANAMSSDRDICLAAGMNDHIGKPFDLNHLINVLCEYSPVITQLSAQREVSVMQTDNGPESLKDLQAIAQLADIELQPALARLGNQLAIYHSMLLMFSDHLSQLPAQLAQWLEKGERIDAARALHTLKGLASQMGAAHLAQVAAEVEVSLRGSATQQECDAGMVRINALLTRVSSGLSALNDALWRTLQTPSESPEHSLTAENEACEKDQTNTHADGENTQSQNNTTGEGISATESLTSLYTDLQQLTQLLLESDMAATILIIEMMKRHEKHYHTELYPISHAIEILDFSHALQLCQLWLAQDVFKKYAK